MANLAMSNREIIEFQASALFDIVSKERIKDTKTGHFYLDLDDLDDKYFFYDSELDFDWTVSHLFDLWEGNGGNANNVVTRDMLQLFWMYNLFLNNPHFRLSSSEYIRKQVFHMADRTMSQIMHDCLSYVVANNNRDCGCDFMHEMLPQQYSIDFTVVEPCDMCQQEALEFISILVHNIYLNETLRDCEASNVNISVMYLLEQLEEIGKVYSDDKELVERSGYIPNLSRNDIFVDMYQHSLKEDWWDACVPTLYRGSMGFLYSGKYYDFNIDFALSTKAESMNFEKVSDDRRNRFDIIDNYFDFYCYLDKIVRALSENIRGDIGGHYCYIVKR